MTRDEQLVYERGFHGMHKVDELKGDGLHYTTEFREYNPKTGRWGAIDPLVSKFPWQSPYVAFDNSPIALSDPRGDSTVYFNSSGEKIHKTMDELENAVVVIDDKNLKEFNRRVEKGEASAEDAFSLRTMGQAYSLADFEGFFDHTTGSAKYNLKSTEVTKKDETMSSEMGTYLYFHSPDGLIHIGREEIWGNSATAAYPTDKDINTGISGAVGSNPLGYLHTHPYAGVRPGYVEGPSGADQGMGFGSGNSYFNIVVEKNTVWFFRSKTKTSFSVDRNSVFNR